MPKSAEKKVAARGGSERFRMAHPKGRPDLNIPVAITKKEGPRGGRTVAMVNEPRKRKAGSWGTAGRETGNCPGMGKSSVSSMKKMGMHDKSMDKMMKK